MAPHYRARGAPAPRLARRLGRPCPRPSGQVPGRFLLVDHSLSRVMDKGALGSLVVTGDARPDIFKALTPEIARRHSGH